MALTDEDVGRFIRRLRVEREMTQTTLASRVRMPRTAISRLENGHRAVTVPELVDIAGVLGVAVGSIAIPSELKPQAAPTTHERPEEVGPLWSRPIRVLGWRRDTPVAIYGLITLLTSRALDVGVQRLRSASNGLRTIRALVMELINAAATVILIAAAWAGLLAVWFTLFDFMLDGHRESANVVLGQGDVTWILFAILLGPALTGGAAFALSLTIRGLISDLVAYAQRQRVHQAV